MMAPLGYSMFQLNHVNVLGVSRMNKPVTFEEVNKIVKMVHDNMSPEDKIKWLGRISIVQHGHINYRPHRGTLAESLRESKVYASLKSLQNAIGFDEVKDYGYDERCRQRLMMVLKNGDPLGFVFEKE